MPADREVDQRGGDVARVDVLVDDGADLSRADPLRRLVAHDDRPAPPRIASPLPPLPGQQRERHQRHGHDPVLEAEAPGGDGRGGTRHEPARPGHRDREPLERRQRARRAERDLVRGGALHRDVLLGAAEAADVGGCLERGVVDRSREPDRRAGPLDRGLPLVAGRVPVELVVLGPHDERVAHAVADDVGDLPVDRAVGVADPQVDVPALLRGLDAVAVARPVLDAEQPETERVDESPRVGVPHRDRAVDPVPRLRELDLQPLGDDDVAVALHVEVGVEAADHVAAAVGERCARRARGGEHHGDQREGEQRDPPRRGPGDHRGLPTSTRGADASARSSSSKKARSEKPKGRATSRSGNDWMRVLRSRTTAL